MAFDANQWVRPHILALAPYSSARDEYTGKEGIFLDANENPLGSVGPNTHNRYPDPYQHALKEQIGRLKGVSPAHIFMGNGSDEPIDLLIRAFCEPREHAVLITPPTYGMYKVSAQINAVQVQEVLLNPDFTLDSGRVLAAVTPQTRIIFLCSPNNPTGNLMAATEVEKVLEGFPGLVVVDEAYIDFTDQPSWISALPRYPNLVVLQTFSKAWGLAALRAGLAFADPSIIRLLNKIKPPYNINAATQAMLAEALAHANSKERMVQEILQEREVLIASLKPLPGVQVIYPSDANFVLIKVAEPDRLYAFLAGRKVVVRNRSSQPLCEGCLRITVGTKAENTALLEAIKVFFGHQQ